MRKANPAASQTPTRTWHFPPFHGVEGRARERRHVQVEPTAPDLSEVTRSNRHHHTFPSPLYHLSQLEEAKKAAQAQNKPIAWIGTFAKCLAPYDKKLTFVH